MADTVRAVSGRLIRLSERQWAHIREEHAELAGLRQRILDSIAAPERVLLGSEGELLAVNEVAPGKWLIVVYREKDDDGFVITAFLTRRARSLGRRRQVWP